MWNRNEILEKIENQLDDSNNIKALRHQDVNLTMLDFIESQWLPGDIKEVDCTDAYIGNNFDGTGKGIIGSEREGWAICNGNNATKNRTGRVSIGYGKNPPSNVVSDAALVGPNNYTPVYGGSKNAVVVDHTHTYVTRTDDKLSEDRRNCERDCLLTQFSKYTTTSAGEDGTNKNMQPYIVTLFIQKL
jgi:hypothetical protein